MYWKLPRQETLSEDATWESPVFYAVGHFLCQCLTPVLIAVTRFLEQFT